MGRNLEIDSLGISSLKPSRLSLSSLSLSSLSLSSLSGGGGAGGGLGARCATGPNVLQMYLIFLLNLLRNVLKPTWY